MAIFPTAEAPQSPQQAATAQPIDIEAWTEQATAALSSVAISIPGAAVQTSTVTLQIPLDELPASRAAPTTPAAKQGNGTSYYRRKEPLRRDSMKSRDALLKGKEGSRRRQRWENDRLLSNPHAEPPTAKDWEVHPTYPVQHVPYYLAPLWDAGLKRQSDSRKANASKAKVSTRTVATKPTEAGVIPKELREKLKRSRGAKGLLMDLESEVRKFVASWEEKERLAAADGLPADPDSEDDEIVFVGRNGAMRDVEPSEQIKRELMVFETEAGDQSGTFGRWLVHHIGTYYGLKTWSVTTGNPARREAYIGLKATKLKAGGESINGSGELPRPLWGLV
ncbi:R3H-associated N-terminal domain-containing protein [Dendryphion nanum]|uniref:R3H-associated N-terminal domain-containing protein n=1 Tax=Dendryphion nanum TaxID=256645 RepID=A0A9P9DL69_9PLEO|nr:R3H-associated N-terminal domain-containing protein [Dendryphion nanum]